MLQNQALIINRLQLGPERGQRMLDRHRRNIFLLLYVEIGLICGHAILRNLGWDKPALIIVRGIWPNVHALAIKLNDGTARKGVVMHMPGHLEMPGTSCQLIVLGLCHVLLIEDL
jgi:hypothetical protein